MRWWWIVLCIMLTPATSAANPDQPARAQPHTTVLVLGDSLSAAYGLAPQQGWVALLQQKLDGWRQRYRVINASISGETTAGGRSRLRRLLTQYEPALVVIALGANDGLRGLPAASMEENLDAMATAVTARGGKLVIVGMRLPPNYGANYDTQFRAVFARVAQRYRAALVPFLLEGFADQRAMFQSDGLHPTAPAQRVILQTMWPSIERALGTSSTRAK